MRQKSDLYKMAVGIAKYLDGFKAIKPEHENSCFVDLVGPQDERLYVRDDKQNGRVRVIGGYPDSEVNWYNHTPYKQSMPEITCAVSRGHLAIAKDISRRLLPLYRPFIAQVKERYNSYKTYVEKQQQVMGEIAKAFGGKVYGSEDSPKAEFGRYRDETKPTGTAKNYYDGRVTLEICLTPQQAVDIANLLMNESTTA